MRRLAAILLICLMLGAIAQTIVAWGCALWVEPVYVGTTYSDDTTDVHWVGTPGGPSVPDVPISGTMTVPVHHNTQFRGFGVRQVTTLSIDLDLDAKAMDARQVGWPIHAWQSVIEGAQLVFAPTHTAKTDEIWFLNGGERLDPSPPIGHTPIPLAVIPLGFAANTALYGLVLFAVFLALRRMRSIIRARRNRCVRCNYDLRETVCGRCPECGATRAVSHAFPT